jgi:ribosomal-protein-alanine N-acetyltransferase
VTPSEAPPFECAGPSDRDALLALEQRSAAHPWTSAHFDAALADEGTRVFVLRAPGAGGISAFCVLARAADEVEVHDVAVAPEARRRGLARALLAHALRDAARSGARVAFLEVRASNVAARALYACLGFVETGRRRAYYREPEEDALLLRLDLGPDGRAA